MDGMGRATRRCGIGANPLEIGEDCAGGTREQIGKSSSSCLNQEFHRIAGIDFAFHKNLVAKESGHGKDPQAG
jgi:hypothetical protein